MAQRRMFSLKVVDTDTFLDMSPTAQNLYFHLGMRADDDGFVASPKKIMQMCGAPDDDMKVLIAKNFIIPMVTNGVCVVTHWKVNNLIRPDRYTETEYLEEKSRLRINKNKWENNIGIPNVIPMVYPGKVRLGKVNILSPQKISATPSKIFDYRNELQKLTEGGYSPKGKPLNRKDYKIIAAYWKRKRFVFENREQYLPAFKRELKAASALKGYNSQQILKTFDYCADKYADIGWTLETVHKRITDLANKI